MAATFPTVHRLPTGRVAGAARSVSGVGVPDHLLTVAGAPRGTRLRLVAVVHVRVSNVGSGRNLTLIIGPD